MNGDGEWRDAEVQQRYARFVQDNHGDIDIPTLCETMANFGARRMSQAQVQFVGLLHRVWALEQSVHRLAELLKAAQQDDVWARGTEWGLSNANAEEHAIRDQDGELESLPF